GSCRNAGHGAQSPVEPGDQLIGGEHLRSLAEKKRAPEGARLQSQYVRLERVAHADEQVRLVRPGVDRAVGRAVRVHGVTRPGERYVRAVVDLRVAEAELRALRERP